MKNGEASSREKTHDKDSDEDKDYMGDSVPANPASITPDSTNPVDEVYDMDL